MPFIPQEMPLFESTIEIGYALKSGCIGVSVAVRGESDRLYELSIEGRGCVKEHWRRLVIRPSSTAVGLVAAPIFTTSTSQREALAFFHGGVVIGVSSGLTYRMELDLPACGIPVDTPVSDIETRVVLNEVQLLDVLALAGSMTESVDRGV